MSGKHTKQSAYRFLWTLGLSSSEMEGLGKRLEAGESPDKVVASARRKTGTVSYQKKIPVKVSTL